MEIQLYNVAPLLPRPLEFLEKLAGNIWWCWPPEAMQ